MRVILDKGQSFTLAEIVNLLRQGKFLLNPEYQRSDLIWPPYKQEKLIDSIIKDLSIGLLFLRKTEGGGYEVLDGQQRLKTIQRFINNEFVTSPDFTPEFPNRSFDDLKGNTRRYSQFNAFEVYYTLVVKGDESEVSDIFLRLQEGTPLNTPEKLNAILGKMREFVIEVTKHQLFENVSISVYRFNHRHIAAQIALLEWGTDFKGPSFPDLRLDDLRELYKKYKRRLPPGLHRRVFGTMNLLHSSLLSDARVIRKKSDLPLVYILSSYVRRKYAISFRSFGQKLRDFLVNFLTLVELANLEEDEEDEYVRYKALRGRGLSAETLRQRFEVLLGAFLAEVPKLKLKHRRRDFDFGQKLAIYYQKDKGICGYAECGEEVEWEEAGFHHIKFHSKGGPTTVENGQLMHKRCHKKFHKIKGRDTDI